MEHVRTPRLSLRGVMWTLEVVLTCSEKYGVTVSRFPLPRQSLQSLLGKQLKLISSS